MECSACTLGRLNISGMCFNGYVMKMMRFFVYVIGLEFILRVDNDDFRWLSIESGAFKCDT